MFLGLLLLLLLFYLFILPLESFELTSSASKLSHVSITLTPLLISYVSIIWYFESINNRIIL